MYEKKTSQHGTWIGKFDLLSSFSFRWPVLTWPANRPRWWTRLSVNVRRTVRSRRSVEWRLPLNTWSLFRRAPKLWVKWPSWPVGKIISWLSPPIKKFRFISNSQSYSTLNIEAKLETVEQSRIVDIVNNMDKRYKAPAFAGFSEFTPLLK